MRGQCRPSLAVWPGLRAGSALGSAGKPAGGDRRCPPAWVPVPARWPARGRFGGSWRRKAKGVARRAALAVWPGLRAGSAWIPPSVYQLFAPSPPSDFNRISIVRQDKTAESRCVGVWMALPSGLQHL